MNPFLNTDGASAVVKAYRQLADESPAFHGADTATNMKLHTAVLSWLRDNVRRDTVTLETGCGYSTVLFAAAGSRHTVVSPTPQEHRRIKEWCAANGLVTDRITFLAGCSEKILPGLQHEEPLDIVLIDGCHAFPFPIMDWFFVAESVRLGGLVIVDDTPIQACKDLERFLLTEKERWKLVANLGVAAVFQKISSPVLAGIEWGSQPYGRTLHSPLRIRLVASTAKLVAKATRSHPGLYRGLRSIYRSFSER